jgi:hypothetical protein
VGRLYPGAAGKDLRHDLQGLLWDPVTSMPAQARESWRQRAIPVAVAAFDGTPPDFWIGHWSDPELDRLSVLHVAVDREGSPRGWVSGLRAGWGGQRVLYAASAGVAPDVQGGGLSAALWRRVVQREALRAFPRTLYVVLRTGNPLVYDAWTAAAGGPQAVHPRPGVPVPPEVLAIANDAAAHLGQAADLDPETLRIHDAYRAVPGGLWSRRPRSRDATTNAWFDQTLQPTDAFIVVAAFSPLSVVRRTVASALPRRNR